MYASTEIRKEEVKDLVDSEIDKVIAEKDIGKYYDENIE